jgi:hypothetical protein
MLNQHETKIIYNFEDHPTNIVIRFQCGCFESFPFRQNFVILVRQITWFRWNAQRWTSGVNVHNKNSKQYVPFYRSIINLKKILTFSVKDRYQLNYFICIKDFNAETITSLKLYLFSFFICGCQHHQSNSVNTGSHLPRNSDVKTRKRRNVVGIDMIRNNCIVW